MNDNDLRAVAERFIYVGGEVIEPDALVEAQREMAQRLAQASALGITERQVVVGLLEPLFSGNTHCGCSSYRERCVVCRYGDA